MPSFKDPIADPDPDLTPSRCQAIRTSRTLRRLHGPDRISRVAM